MRKRIFAIITVFLFCAILAGCTSFYSKGTFKGFSGSQYGTSMNAKFSYFNGERGARISLKQGDRISIKYDINCDEGRLTLAFEDKNGNTLFTAADAAGTETVTVDSDGKYTLQLTGADAKGNYTLSWDINP